MIGAYSLNQGIVQWPRSALSDLWGGRSDAEGCLWTWRGDPGDGRGTERLRTWGAGWRGQARGMWVLKAKARGPWNSRVTDFPGRS